LTIYTFWRLLFRNGILPGAKFTLRPPSLDGSRAVGASQTLRC